MSVEIVETENGVICPTCGDTFKDERGMSIHHTRTHGERLRETVECHTCGVSFDVRRWRAEAERNYCSDDCKYEDLSDYQSGENNPCWNGGVSILDGECIHCGTELTGYQTNKETTWGRFCSLDCKAEWQHKHVNGENHPSWEGGKVEYGVGWKAIRQRVRRRDQYRCQSCHRLSYEFDRELHVHHIIPLRKYDDPNEANKLDNLITLCFECHPKWEGIGLAPDNRAYDQFN